MNSGHWARRLAATAGVAAIIAMGAITAACGGSSANGYTNTPPAATTSLSKILTSILGPPPTRFDPQPGHSGPPRG